MKFFLPVLVLFFAFASCKKEKNTSMSCLEATFLQKNFPSALQSVFFLNGKDGFVSDNNGGIYKTIDSAQNWTLLNSAISLPVRTLFFIDALKGFAAGGQITCNGTGCVVPGGFILKTLDGGQTWTKVYTPVDKLEINSIWFVNELKGFCVGGNVIFKTLDGGQTWTENKVNNAGINMSQIRFVNDQKGYIASLSGKLIITQDGGSTWEVTTPLGNIGYYSVSESNGSVYVGGQGKIIKSTNDGTSWRELSKSPGDIFAIHFVDDKRGFAFGRGIYSGGDFGFMYGSMYCTNDGGDTWNGSSDLNEAGLIQSVSFPTGNIGYAISGYNIIKLAVK